MGNVQITTQAVQELCQSETPVCYFHRGLVLRRDDG